MNSSMEEGIILVVAVGGVYNTWQAPQHCTTGSLAPSFLSAVSNYHVPRWTQATAMGKTTMMATKRERRWERKVRTWNLVGGRDTQWECGGRKVCENEAVGNILTGRGMQNLAEKGSAAGGEGGLMQSIKGKWVRASCQYQFIATRLKCVATTFYDTFCG